MTFAENPYGETIPDVFLDSKMVLRDGKSTLREKIQDGNILNDVFNEKDKTSPAEAFNDVLLAPIFKKLWDNEECCPSNYVSNVIFELTKYEMEHNTSFSHEFYAKFIARSLRAFASYIREKSLEEIVCNLFTTVANEKKYSIEIGAADEIEEDLKNKTDILIILNGYTYRIWSFQSTDAGCKCTGRRAVNAKKGVNIFVPFNIKDKYEVFGWFLYNSNKTTDQIKSAKAENFADFKKEVLKNNKTLKVCHKVVVR